MQLYKPTKGIKTSEVDHRNDDNDTSHLQEKLDAKAISHVQRREAHPQLKGAYKQHDKIIETCIS